MSTLDKREYSGRKRRRMKKFRLDEISLVDQPAHTPARVAIMKRAGDAPGAVDTAIQKNVKMGVTSMNDGHAHTIVLIEANAEGMAEKRAGQTSFADGHVHDWIMDDAGNIIIAENMGHSHAIVVQVTKSADSENEIDPAAVLAAAGVDHEQASEEPTAETGESPQPGADEMSNQTDRTADDNAKAVTPEQHEEVVTKAARLDSIVKLSPEQRAHFDGLSPEGQDEFLAAENKDAIVKNAQDSDPIVFEDGDIVLRKSAGESTIALAKQNKALREQVARTEAIAKKNDLLKRSSELLKNCKGSGDVKAAVLGAVEGIADDELRKGAMELLTAKDAGLSKAFEEVGTSDDNGGEGSEPEQRLNSIAKSLREKNPQLTDAQAYVEALETPEGRELHAQLRSNG